MMLYVNRNVYVILVYKINIHHHPICVRRFEKPSDNGKLPGNSSGQSDLKPAKRCILRSSSLSFPAWKLYTATEDCVKSTCSWSCFLQKPLLAILLLFTPLISFLTLLLHVLTVLRVWPASHGLLKRVSQIALPTSEWIQFAAHRQISRK